MAAPFSFAVEHCSDPCDRRGLGAGGSADPAPDL